MQFTEVAIIFVYMAIVAGVGFWFAKGQTKDTFFVTKQARSVWLTLFSVVATNVGAATLLGVASEGYKTGLSWGLNMTLIVVFGFFFLGFCASRLKRLADDGQLSTMSQFYLVRYSSEWSHRISSLLVLAAYLIFASAQFRGLSQMLLFWTNIPALISIIVAGLLVVFLTSLRGIKGDMYTDGISFFVMLVGVVIILPYFVFTQHVTFDQIHALNATFFSPFTSKGETFFWGSILFGIPVLFASMEFWQLLFSMKDETPRRTKARNLFFLAGLLNAPMLLVPTMLGLADRVLNPTLSNADLALIDVMQRALPVIPRAIAEAALLAAILSTVNAMIIVASSTLSLDIIERQFKRHVSLRLGRLLTAFVAIIAAFLASRLGSIVDQLIFACQIIGILAPSLIGGLWLDKRFGKAALTSLIVGLTVFVACFVIPGFSHNLAFIPAIILSSLSYLCAVAFIMRKLRNL